jgi:hypothetical protein
MEIVATASKWILLFSMESGSLKITLNKNNLTEHPVTIPVLSLAKQIPIVLSLRDIKHHSWKTWAI